MGWCAVVLFLASAGCARKAVTPKQEAKSLEVPRSAAADDVARLLGGIPGRADCPFHDLESEPAWKLHSKDLSKMGERFEKERLPQLQRFEEKEITGGAFSGGTLFYPFGGPDILTARTLFPRKKTFLLVGLEPPGSLPDDKAIRSADLERYLPRIRRTVDSLLRRSFFITASMDGEVRGQITDGLLPVMLVQLARMNCQVLGDLPVTLDSQGKVVARAEKRQRASSLRNDGVAIDFRCPGSEVQRLLYYSVNLSDEALASNRAFQAFLRKQEPLNTFFKSASYLPHRKEFSSIRELVLRHSDGIVQDDTGIPYRYVDHNKWDVRLYGGYTRPYGSFRFMTQPDLRKAYEEGKPTPLHFFLGYGFGRIPSTLLVFTRRS